MICVIFHDLEAMASVFFKTFLSDVVVTVRVLIPVYLKVLVAFTVAGSMLRELQALLISRRTNSPRILHLQQNAKLTRQ